MKKLLTLIVALTLVMTTAVFAAQDDKGLTEAVVCVKSIVDIGDEYKDFTYHSYENDNGGTWSLNWNSENGYISAEVVGGNTLLTLSIGSKDEKPAGLSAVSLEDANRLADEFLKKALPQEFQLMQRRSDSETIDNSSDYSYNIVYSMYVNGVPVQNHTVTVDVSKSSGRVSDFYREFYDKTPITFAPNENAITKEDAIKKYTENIGLELKYNIYYDYEAKTAEVKPVYEINGFGTKAIDAVSGDAVEMPVNENFYDMGGSGGIMPQKAMATDESANSVSLSPEEQAAVDNVKGLLTKADALDYIAEQIPDMGDGLSDSYSRLYSKRFEKDKFLWEITLEKNGEYYLNATIDAKTGKIESFSRSYEDKKGYRQITREKAREIVETYLKSTKPTEFAACEYTEETHINPRPLMTAEDGKQTDKVEDYYYFTYVRKVNGIKTYDNSLSVGFDNTNGIISSLYTSWSSSLSFPTLEGIISADAAANAAAEKGGFNLEYLTDGTLAYTYGKFSTIGAFSGDALDYDGKPAKEDYKPAMYTDISGHWCEGTIRKLYENGIYKKGAEFKPDENISQRDALMLIAPAYCKDTDEDLYRYAVDFGFVSENEKNPDGAVSRKMAAKLFVNAMNYTEIAEKNEIFNYPFTDSCENEFKGYIAICKAFGIVSGDENGAFCPENNVTNAEFACMVYNYKLK